MKYISCDIETFGLDPEHCDLIQVAAVFDPLLHTEDGMLTSIEKLPTFECFIGNPDKNIKANLVAMGMHQDSGLLEKWMLADKVSTVDFVDLFDAWLKKVYPLEPKEKYNFAGKNFAGFDRKFLQSVENFDIIDRDIHHRVIDPAELYIDFFKDNEKPNLNTCLSRAGIEKSVSHWALDDCFDVIKVLRHAAFRKLN